MFLWSMCPILCILCIFRGHLLNPCFLYLISINHVELLKTVTPNDTKTIEQIFILFLYFFYICLRFQRCNIWPNRYNVDIPISTSQTVTAWPWPCPLASCPLVSHALMLIKRFVEHACTNDPVDPDGLMVMYVWCMLIDGICMFDD